MVLWLLIDLCAYVVNAANRAIYGGQNQKALSSPCSGGACSYHPPSKRNHRRPCDVASLNGASGSANKEATNGRIPDSSNTGTIQSWTETDDTTR
jgi:hypothetical protein